MREGNTECWSEDDPKGFDDCCDTRSHGPLGNILCWEGGKSYNECCYPPFPPAGLPDLCEDIITTITITINYLVLSFIIIHTSYYDYYYY